MLVGTSSRCPRSRQPWPTFPLGLLEALVLEVQRPGVLGDGTNGRLLKAVTGARRHLHGHLDGGTGVGEPLDHLLYDPAELQVQPLRSQDHAAVEALAAMSRSA